MNSNITLQLPILMRERAKLVQTLDLRMAKLKRQELLEANRRFAVFHEVGHFVVAMHFKAEMVRGEIWEAEIGLTRADPDFGGQTWFEAMREDNLFKRAVLAWAGYLGGALSGQTIEEWQDDMYELFENYQSWSNPVGWFGVSDSDHEGIVAHPMRWRAFKTAAAIIVKRHTEFERVAQDLEQYGFIEARRGKYVNPRAFGNHVVNPEKSMRLRHYANEFPFHATPPNAFQWPVNRVGQSDPH